MADTNFIHQLLHMNGVGPDASDKELEALFLQAGWSKEDIKKTIAGLRHPEKGEAKNVVAPHGPSLAANRSDDISALLGIDIIVDPSMVRDSTTHQLTKERRALFASIRTWALLIVVASTLALVASWGAFYLMDIGPFKSTAADEGDW